MKDLKVLDKKEMNSIKGGGGYGDAALSVAIKIASAAIVSTGYYHLYRILR